MLRIFKLQSAEIAEKRVIQTIARDACHEIAPVTSLNEKTALGTLFDTFYRHLRLFVHFFLLLCFNFSEFSAVHPRMWRLSVTTWAHFNVAKHAIKSLSLWVDKLTVVATRALFQHLEIVIWFHGFQLQTHNPVIFIFCKHFFQYLISDILRQTLRAFRCHAYLTLAKLSANTR
jgi:hypothetical protein